MDGEFFCFFWGGEGDTENFVFHFYVTVVIILSGVGSLLKGMTQLRFSPSCEG